MIAGFSVVTIVMLAYLGFNIRQSSEIGKWLHGARDGGVSISCVEWKKCQYAISRPDRLVRFFVVRSR